MNASIASNPHLYSRADHLPPLPEAPKRPPVIILRTCPAAVISLLYGKAEDHTDHDVKMLLERFRRRAERQVLMTEAVWLGFPQRSLILYRHIAVDRYGRLLDGKNNTPFGNN